MKTILIFTLLISMVLTLCSGISNPTEQIVSSSTTTTNSTTTTTIDRTEECSKVADYYTQCYGSIHNSGQPCDWYIIPVIWSRFFNMCISGTEISSCDL